MSALLPMAAPVPGVAPEPGAGFSRAVRRVELLSWISLVWMGAEGAIAVVAGILAGSIALVGFGIDSAIEGFASDRRSRTPAAATATRSRPTSGSPMFLIVP